MKLILILSLLLTVTALNKKQKKDEKWHVVEEGKGIIYSKDVGANAVAKGASEPVSINYIPPGDKMVKVLDIDDDCHNNRLENNKKNSLRKDNNKNEETDPTLKSKETSGGTVDVNTATIKKRLDRIDSGISALQTEIYKMEIGEIVRDHDPEVTGTIYMKDGQIDEEETTIKQISEDSI